MALTTIQTNNKLIQFRREIIREYVRENLFSPYMGDGLTAIIRTLSDNKKGGEQINIPLVTALNGPLGGATQSAISTGTQVGNEEQIDNYGCRLYVDWARHAVVTNDAENQKDSAAVFEEARPLLGDWGKELQRDEIIGALMALPSESAPVNLGTTNGQRVNGVLFEAATAGQRNTWNTDNSDRVLYGATTANFNATFATALLAVDNTSDVLSAANVQLLKLVARRANPKIRPYKLGDGREYFVAFCGSYAFRDLKNSLATVNKDARPREGDGMNRNPIFQDGDQIYDGVIVREVPEIDLFVENVWTTLLTAGSGSGRVNPVFLCGQSAVAMPWAKLPVPTVRSEDDYQFIKGVGVKMCYGIGKLFKKHPQAGTKLVQWGVATGFMGSTAT